MASGITQRFARERPGRTRSPRAFLAVSASVFAVACAADPSARAPADGAPSPGSVAGHAELTKDAAGATPSRPKGTRAELPCELTVLEALAESAPENRAKLAEMTRQKAQFDAEQAAAREAREAAQRDRESAPIRWNQPEPIATAPEPPPERVLPAQSERTAKTDEEASAPSGAGRADSDAVAAAIASALPLAGGQDRPPAVVEALAAAARAIRDPAASLDGHLLDTLEPADRAVVERFHEACIRVGRDLREGRPADEAAAALADLAAVLRESQLQVPRVEFCTRVEGFGRFTSLTQRRFLPGRGNQVIVYTEVDGFRSEQGGGASAWTTRLATRVEIYSRHEPDPVWTREWQPVVDESAVRRDDFFICERLTLSEYLTVGSYVLKSIVRDELSGAVSERSVDFQIVAGESG